MKKLITLTIMCLLSTALFAQNWQAPSESEYPTSTIFYIQTNVNGVENLELEIAAFIDGECRAVDVNADLQTNNGIFYALRVWGNDTDMNKTITFKAYNAASGLTYRFNTTALFDGETNPNIPFILNIDEPAGVEIDSPISIEDKLPFYYDLNNHIRFTYPVEPGSLVSDYYPLGESVIETPLIYEWSNSNSEYFTIDGNNMMDVTQATPVDGVYESLTVKISNDVTLGSARTQFFITEPIVPVIGISCSLTEVNINKGESLYRLEELTQSIVISPDDASNKGYKFVGNNSDAEVAIVDGIAMRGGSYSVKIVSLENEYIYTTITVNVYAPVTSININTDVVHAKLNDNVFERIAPYIEVVPEDATDKSYTFDTSAANGAIVDGIASKPGRYTINVISTDNPEVVVPVTVVITEIYAPEKIEVNINENVYDILQSLIYVEPQSEQGYIEYEIMPADQASSEAIVEGVATQKGEYTLIVTSTVNKEVSKEIKVYVVVPVEITFPETLTLSKYKDTLLELTLVEGENYDPNLLEIVFVKNIEPIDLGLPTFTAVGGSNNLEWNVRALGCGSFELSVLYNGKPMLNTSGSEITYVEVPVEVTYNSNGWDWISVGAEIMLTQEGDYLRNMNIDENNRVIEIRSQRQLLYNDATIGFFGDLVALVTGDGMYKIKSSYESSENCIFTSKQNYYNRAQTQTVAQGYTWIAYDNEWDMTIDEFNSIYQNIPNEGDQIIGKEGFAEYTEGQWVASDGFYLQAGKGYLYYNSADYSNVLTFDYIPTYWERSMARRNAKAENTVWQYDASQFADNMTIVAQVIDINNPEDYVIGAFVNGECRGVGRAVIDDKIMLSVAGKAGEEVTFTLYNEVTGEFIDVKESTSYKGKMGSLNAPATFTTALPTDINTTLTDSDKSVTYYNMNGCCVNPDEVQNGVYIVRIVDGDQVTTKKIIINN